MLQPEESKVLLVSAVSGGQWGAVGTVLGAAAATSGDTRFSGSQPWSAWAAPAERRALLHLLQPCISSAFSTAQHPVDHGGRSCQMEALLWLWQLLLQKLPLSYHAEAVLARHCKLGVVATAGAVERMRPGGTGAVSSSGGGRIGDASNGIN